MTPEELEADFRNYDHLFDVWKRKNPEGTFARFGMNRIVNGLKKGRPHETLGPNLKEGDDWWEHGRPSAQAILELSRISEDAKVAEYGCGSLRVGAHFIKRQKEKSYLGLDVTTHLIALGKDILGELIAEKKPAFAAANKWLKLERDFGADLVFTNSVAQHVHPREEEDHYSILKLLAGKPGAKIIIHSYLGDRQFRYARSGWARPLNHYERLLEPFRLVDAVDDQVIVRNNLEVNVKYLLFQR